MQPTRFYQARFVEYSDFYYIFFRDRICHETLKNHCDSEQSVKFEKYGWKNAVSSPYLMRGVFHSTSLVEFEIFALIILRLFDETT